jgi:hypothetical protein
MDHTLMRHSFGPDRFSLAIGKFAPRALAFNTKKAASVYLARSTKLIGYGRQAERIGKTPLYVPGVPATVARAGFVPTVADVHGADDPCVAVEPANFLRATSLDHWAVIR